MLPKPPRLLVEVELVVPEVPLDDGERPTTVGVEVVLGRPVVVGDRGNVVDVVLRRLPPPHHQPPVEPVEPERVLLLLLELHRSGCHKLVGGFCRHVVPA